MSKIIKVGIDVHGVLDRYSTIFKDMTREMTYSRILDEVEIHIITGQEESSVVDELKAIGIYYHKLFSVVDYHKKIGTKMWLGPKGTWFCDPKIWDATKGEYCVREGIDIHFDDTLEYAKYMPKTTTFIHVPKVGFENFYELFQIM